jgi:predicted nucleic acid-binding protein
VNAYFDTSAIVPLLVDEPGSEVAGRLWDDAGRLASVVLMPVEARAALARARRIGRLRPAEVAGLAVLLDDLCGHVDRVAVDESLVRRAGALADELDLRGYDAVHLAACERIADDETSLVTGDRRMADAARKLGLATSLLPTSPSA